MNNPETTSADGTLNHDLSPEDDVETSELNIEPTILEPEQIILDEVAESSLTFEHTEPIETIDENTHSELGNANSALSSELKHAVGTSEIELHSNREVIPSERLSETMNPPGILGVPSPAQPLQQPIVEPKDIYEALQTTVHVGINQKMPPLGRTLLSPNEDNSTRIHHDAISMEKNIVNRPQQDSERNSLGLAVRSDLVDAVFRNFDPRRQNQKYTSLIKDLSSSFRQSGTDY